MSIFLKKLIWANCTITGRMSRYDYWIYGMLSFYGIIISIAGLSFFLSYIFENEIFNFIIFLCFGLYIWHAWSVTFKRLHDQNITGAFIFINLIPVIGIISYGIILISCMFRKGTIGPNEYGPDPTEIIRIF